MNHLRNPAPLRCVDNDEMSALAAMLRPTPFGWDVQLTDGRVLARFFGPCARRRALRYLTSFGAK
jgi:hypothetical protein